MTLNSGLIDSVECDMEAFEWTHNGCIMNTAVYRCSALSAIISSLGLSSIPMDTYRVLYPLNLECDMEAFEWTPDGCIMDTAVCNEWS